MIEHYHYFLLTEQTLAHQVFGEQREELGAAVAFQMLEFGEGAIDLAGRTQASALRDGGYGNGLIVARNEAAGRALAQNLGYEWQAELGDARPQMLINVTPIGMTGGAEADALAFDAAAVDAADTVFDVVAIPAETPLIVRGRAQGKRVITGLEVIAIQALEQFVLYTGVRPTDEQFQAAVAFART